MHVYISIDMEGVAGVAARTQVIRGRDDYPRARAFMTGEANAGVAGAFNGGAARVTVNDAHGDMSNLLPDELDDRAELILGSPKAASMVEGIDAPADVALFLGYHAAAGVEGGVLAHTYSSHAFTDVRLNGEPATEAEINAHVAAVHGVPVGLVTGDDHVCQVARDRLPGVRTVAVKRGLGFTATASLHPTEARERIREAAAATVEHAGELAPTPTPASFEVEADLVTLTMADMCALVPGARRQGRTVAFQADTATDALRCLRTWMYVASAAR